VFSVGLLSNRQVDKGILFEVALIVLITLLPPLQGVFHTCPLTAQDYLFLALLPPAVLLLEEGRKAIVRRHGHYDRNGVRADAASER
jgi:Ca2+-transporting ATPase